VIGVAFFTYALVDGIFTLLVHFPILLEMSNFVLQIVGLLMVPMWIFVDFIFTPGDFSAIDDSDASHSRSLEVITVK
jgi:hypothetical protein